MLSRFPNHRMPRPEELGSSRSFRAWFRNNGKMLLLLLIWATASAGILIGTMKFCIHLGL